MVRAMRSVNEARCPLFVWAVAYIAGISGADVLSRLAAKRAEEPWLAYPGTVSFAAVCVSVIVLECLIARGWKCEWVEHQRTRFFAYVLSFLVGMVIWSGLTTEHGVPIWYRAVVIALFVAPLVGLAATHATHHLNKALRMLARVPLIVLLLMIATLVFFAITNLI